MRHLPVTSGTGKLLRSVFVPTYARLRTPALEVSNRSAQELGSLHRINMCGPPKTAKYIKRSRRTVDKHRANQGSNTGPRGPPPHFNDETFATTTQSRKYTRRLEGRLRHHSEFRRPTGTGLARESVGLMVIEVLCEVRVSGSSRWSRRRLGRVRRGRPLF